MPKTKNLYENAKIFCEKSPLCGKQNASLKDVKRSKNHASA
jgi:hypothetical protein